ncbi:poly(A) RNA polymerase protein 2-like [Citrus sinensis]|uniref:poly(A) RNA polymerase protein 2-like n=1 Tax=Citrus sinensis TaxID=2711 RepID=UPI002278F2CB|nr:poly(A) RNA polymerase protein 2-like [Citrus sinensis]
MEAFMPELLRRRDRDEDEGKYEFADSKRYGLPNGDGLLGCQHLTAPNPKGLVTVEIVDFCDFLSPTSEEREVRTTAGEAVLDLFKYTWPKCKPKVFGTFRTGLYLPTSDIDVVIMESGIHNPATALQALSRALLQRGIAKKIQVIAKARVPIVKFFEKKSGVSFDISYGKNVLVCSKKLLQVGPIFHCHELYLLCLPFVSDHVGYPDSLYECRASPEHNLEILLVNFFDFYGRKLKTTDVGVSCKGAGSFFKKSSKGFTNKGRPFLIAIEDLQVYF